MPTAFVVMPFREPFESLYANIIWPALVDIGVEPIRADQIFTSSNIVADITEQIRNADLIIVEATHPNPNVYFEFGYAYANDKEFLLLAQKGTDLPFDTRQIRHLIYVEGNVDVLRADFTRWLSTTKVVRRRQKLKQGTTLNRGEIFDELFDSAMLSEQFKDPVETSILQQIKQGDRMSCLLSYSTEAGTDCWLRLCSDPLYSVFQESMQFLKSHADAIIEALPVTLVRSFPDFVSLGPGNGQKDRTLLRSLAKRLSKEGLEENLYYYPVDISLRMLAAAISTVSGDSELRGRLKIKALLGDFERLRLFAPVYDYRPEANIFCLLGNTLGNLVHDGDFLNKMWGTMHDGDVLILEVRSKQVQLALSGKPEDQYGLSFAPLALLGVAFDSAKIEVTKRDASSQIHGTVGLAVHYKDFSIRGNRFNDLILSWVNFYDSDSLSEMLGAIGFKTIKYFETQHLLLFVLQK